MLKNKNSNLANVSCESEKSEWVASGEPLNASSGPHPHPLKVPRQAAAAGARTASVKWPEARQRSAIWFDENSLRGRPIKTIESNMHPCNVHQ